MELRIARDEPAVGRTMWRHAPITVEVRGGETRYPGTELEAPLPTNWVGYGYFEGMPAEDGDSLDAVLGPDFAPDWEGPVFVAEQVDPDDGSRLQDKVFLGFERKDEAQAAFQALWPSSMFGGLSEIDPDKFEHTVLPTLITAPDEAREPTDTPDAANARTAAGDTAELERLYADLYARAKAAGARNGHITRPDGSSYILPPPKVAIAKYLANAERRRGLTREQAIADLSDYLTGELAAEIAAFEGGAVERKQEQKRQRQEERLEQLGQDASEVDWLRPTPKALRGKKVWMYHVTSTALLPTILREGLNPTPPTRTFPRSEAHGTSLDCVYLLGSGSSPLIDFYAQRARAVHGGKGVVLRVLVDADLLEPDPDDADLPSGRGQATYCASIPPSDIMQVDGQWTDEARKSTRRRKTSAVDVIVWHKLRIALEARGGEQRPTGDEQQIPSEWRGLGYFEGLADRSDQDGQELDVVVGGGDLDGPVFLAIQLDDSGAFRQFKSFLGFTDAGQVEAAFKFIWNPKTFGGAWSVPAKRFRKLVLPRLTKEAGAAVRSVGQDGLRKLAVLQLEVDPARIEPPHGVKNKAKLERLVESMRASGWNGRSILVYRSGGSYQALTGSHRLAAARAAGLDRIPVLLIEDTDFDEGSYTALDEAGDNYGRLSALDGLIKAKPDAKPAYELMLQELAEKHNVKITKTSARPRKCSHCGETMDAADVFGEEGRYFHRPCVGRGPIDRTAERINRKQYRSLVHRCTKAKLLGELEGVEVYRVDGSWVRDHIDVDFAHGAHYLGAAWVPKGEVWVDANLEDKDLAAALVGQLAGLEDMQRGSDAEDAREAAKVAEAEFREAYEKGKSPFKQVKKWLSRPLEVDGDEVDGEGPPPFEAELPVQLGDRTAARRRRRKRQRDRVFKPSWYLPAGGRVAVSGAHGAGAGGDAEGSVVTLRPGARVLHMSEDALRSATASGMKRAAGATGAEAFEVFGARDVVAYDLMAMVRSQTEAIQKLTLAVERLQAVNGGNYDAIQTEDRLIVLDPKMVQAEPVRRRWLNAALRVGGDEIEVTG